MDNTVELRKQIWLGLAEIKVRIYQICYVLELVDIPITKNIDDNSYLDLERSSALTSLVHEVSETTADKATAIFDKFEELERSLK